MAKVGCEQTNADSFFGNLTLLPESIKRPLPEEGIFAGAIPGGSVRANDEIRRARKDGE